MESVLCFANLLREEIGCVIEHHYSNSPYWSSYMSLGTNWENLLRHPDHSPLVIISQFSWPWEWGDIWCWSLLGQVTWCKATGVLLQIETKACAAKKRHVMLRNEKTTTAPHWKATVRCVTKGDDTSRDVMPDIAKTLAWLDKKPPEGLRRKLRDSPSMSSAKKGMVSDRSTIKSLPSRACKPSNTLSAPKRTLKRKKKHSETWH